MPETLGAGSIAFTGFNADGDDSAQACSADARARP